jgi:hypothetical protein
MTGFSMPDARTASRKSAALSGLTAGNQEIAVTSGLRLRKPWP